MLCIVNTKKNKVMEWIKFKDMLPATEQMKQINILFASPNWATFYVGVYCHNTDEPLLGRILSYDQDDDSFYVWDSVMPTHYMIAPELPEI